MKKFHSFADFYNFCKRNFTYILTIGSTFIALLLIIFFTYGSFYKNAKNNILTICKKSIMEESSKIERCISPCYNTLAMSVNFVEYLLNNGLDEVVLQEYLVTKYESTKKMLSGYSNGMYGVINGVYVDGSGWVPDESYIPEERPWYKAAMKKKDGVVIVNPYFDAETNKLMVSFSKCLNGGKDVIAIDCFLDILQSAVSEIDFEGKRSCFILDKDGYVVAHSDIQELGKNYLEIVNNYQIDKRDAVDGKYSFKDGYCEVKSGKNKYLVFSNNLEHVDWTFFLVVNRNIIFKNIEYNLQRSLFLSFCIFLIVGYFCTSNYINRKKESYHNRQITKLLQKEGVYKQAIIKDARSYFECNLSKNFLIAGMYDIKDPNVGAEREKVHGFKDLGFDELEKFFIAHTLLTEKERAEKFLTCENLISLYKKGESTPEISYWSSIDNKKPTFIQQSFFIQKDTASDDIICFCVVKDLTEEKQNAIEIARAHEVFEIFSDEYSAVYYVDFKDESIIPYRRDDETDKNFLPWFKDGMSYKEACESYVESRVFEEDKPFVLKNGSIENMKEILSKKRSFQTVYRCRKNNDGDEFFYCELKCVRIGGSADEVTAVVIGYADKDIEIREKEEQQNQLKEAREKAEEASKAKSTFLFNMSHDIRTPMNAILGFNGMAKKYIDNKEKVLDCIDKVSIASDYLLKLIDEVLDMARIENGKLVIEEEPVSITKCVEDLLTVVESTVNSKKLNLGCRFENLTNDLVYADKMKLNRVFLNVISNSIKYTNENGKICFVIKQKNSVLAGWGMYDFIIEDTGVGMSEDFMAHMFEMFSRERTSTECGVHGTGLGMSITKNLVEAMKGSINVESTSGKGTKVHFNIPFKFCDKEKLNVTEDSVENKVVLKGKRVLLVEDNEMNRMIAVDNLEDEGCIVEEAENGKIAVEKVNNNESGFYDIILMDIQMPVMDGYSAAKEIRALKDEKKASVPIIAMTANAFSEDKKKAFETGMNEYLTKPIEAEKLIQAISQYMA